MRFKLSLFWFVYMIGLGTFFPFFSLYLHERLGFSGTQVGLVTAIIPLIGLAAQPLWGHVADRTGSRRLVLAVVTCGVGVGYLALGFFEDFGGALGATAFLAAFLTVVLSLATAVTLGALAAPDPDGDHQHLGPQAFGRVRLWGTVGFLVAVVAFPRLLESQLLESQLLESTFADLGLPSTPWHGLGLLFPIAACASLGAAVIARGLPSSRALTLRSEPGDVGRLLRHAPAWRLFLLVFVAHACLQGPIYLFPLFITDLGGDVSTLGSMWIFMLLLEIPLIGYAGATLRKLGARGVLMMGLVAEAVRWVTCALTTDLAVIQAVQLLHGVGVAGIIIGAPLYLEQAVPERLRATGQALVSAAGYGAGAIVSNTVGGWLFDHVGPKAPYVVAGTGLVALCLLLYAWLPEPYRPDSPDSAPPTDPTPPPGT